MQNYLFTSDIFKGSRYEKGHPLDMDRVWPSVELIQLMGWVNEEQIIKNKPAEIDELIKFHDLEYVKALKKAEEELELPEQLKRRYNIGIGNNVFSSLTLVGSTFEEISFTEVGCTCGVGFTAV